MRTLFLALTFLTTLHTTNLIYGNDIKLEKLLEDTLLKGEKLGEGSFGIVYSDPSKQYVIKESKNSENMDDFISEGDKNEILFKDIKVLDDQAFYKESIGFITKYLGKIKREEKTYLIFERAPGDEFRKLLEIEQYLLPAYNKAYAKLQEEGNANPTEMQIKEKIKNMSEKELFPNTLNLAKTYKEQTIKLLNKLDTINVKAINEQNFQAKVKRNLLVQAQLANALAVEHDAGKVHLDVKPDNTMVYIPNKYSNNPIVSTKVIDHGTMVDLTDPNDTKRNSNGTGTEVYMSPEEINFKDQDNPYFVSKRGVSPAADVYSHAMSTLDALFGGTAFWAKYADMKIWGQAAQKKINQILFKALEDKDFLIKQKKDGRLQAEYSDIQLKFLNQLFRDCLNPNPAERPSMAQVGELLQVVLSTFTKERENTIIGTRKKTYTHKIPNASYGCDLDYQQTKATTELDRPKAIPMAIRNMIKSSNDKQRNKGFEVLDLLIKADPSYEATPSYGLAMFHHKHYKKYYTTWAKNEKNKAAVDFLKKYTYINGNPIPHNLPVAPISVSEPIYKIIQEN